MKKFLVGFLFLMMVSSSFAKTVAWVTEVGGNAFVVNSEKQTKTLMLGTQIEDFSKVMVEDGSTLSLINNFGHEIYLTSGSYVKFFNGLMELVNGHVWVISKDSKRVGEMNTSNATVKFTEGQFILSYDNNSGKSQILSLSGVHKFANNYEADLLIDVPEAHFSFVDAKYENSLPRKPTKVGEKSHSQFKQKFADFDHLRDSDVHQRHWSPAKKQLRSIASVNDQFSTGQHMPTAARGKIIKIKTYDSSRAPASVPSPMAEYSKLKKAEKRKLYNTKTKNKATITYFGFDRKITRPKLVIKTNQVNQKTPSVRTNRAPASIQKKDLIRELSRKPQSVFEKSLEVKIEEEKKHPKEVNQLIDELKSFSQDYNKKY